MPCLSGSALKASNPRKTEEVAPGVMLDFDDRGEVIGVEILYVSQRMARRRAAAE